MTFGDWFTIADDVAVSQLQQQQQQAVMGAAVDESKSARLENFVNTLLELGRERKGKERTTDTVIIKLLCSTESMGEGRKEGGRNGWGCARHFRQTEPTPRF